MVAEASVREYLDYARAAHCQPLGEQAATPLMYMNGLEIFCEHPELWSFEMERVAGCSTTFRTEGPCHRCCIR